MYTNFWNCQLGGGAGIQGEASLPPPPSNCHYHHAIILSVAVYYIIHLTRTYSSCRCGFVQNSHFFSHSPEHPTNPLNKVCPPSVMKHLNQLEVARWPLPLPLFPGIEQSYSSLFFIVIIDFNIVKFLWSKTKIVSSHLPVIKQLYYLQPHISWIPSTQVLPLQSLVRKEILQRWKLFQQCHN